MVDASNSCGAAISVPFRRASCDEGAASSALAIAVIGQSVALPQTAPDESPKDLKIFCVVKYSNRNESRCGREAVRLGDRNVEILVPAEPYRFVRFVCD